MALSTLSMAKCKALTGSVVKGLKLISLLFPILALYDLKWPWAKPVCVAQWANALSEPQCLLDLTGWRLQRTGFKSSKHCQTAKQEQQKWQPTYHILLAVAASFLHALFAEILRVTKVCNSCHECQCNTEPPAVWYKAAANRLLSKVFQHEEQALHDDNLHRPELRLSFHNSHWIDTHPPDISCRWQDG